MLFSFFFNIQEFTYENPSLPPDMDVRGITTYKYHLTITIICCFFPLGQDVNECLVFGKDHYFSQLQYIKMNVYMFGWQTGSNLAPALQNSMNDMAGRPRSNMVQSIMMLLFLFADKHATDKKV